MPRPRKPTKQRFFGSVTVRVNDGEHGRMQGIADQLGIGLGAATRLLVRLGLANVERDGLAALSGLEKGA